MYSFYLYSVVFYHTVAKMLIGHFIDKNRLIALPILFKTNFLVA